MLAIKINIHFHLFCVPNFEMVYACMYITPNDQYKQMKRTSTIIVLMHQYHSTSTKYLFQ